MALDFLDDVLGNVCEVSDKLRKRVVYEVPDKLRKRKDAAKYYYNELEHGRFKGFSNKDKIRGELFSPKALLDMQTEKQIVDSCLTIHPPWYSSKPCDLEKVPEGFIPIGFANEGLIYADPTKDEFLNQAMAWMQTRSGSGARVPLSDIRTEFGWGSIEGLAGKKGLSDVQIAKHFATLAYRYSDEAKDERQQLKVAVMANTAKYMLAESVYGELVSLCETKNPEVFDKLMNFAKQYRKDSEKLQLDKLIEKYEDISVKVGELTSLETQISERKEAAEIKKEVEKRNKIESKKQKEAKKDAGKIKL